MFVTPRAGLLYRSRNDLARAQGLPGLSRRHTAPFSFAPHDIWLPNTSRYRSQRSSPSRLDNYRQPGLRVDEIDDEEEDAYVNSSRSNENFRRFGRIAKSTGNRNEVTTRVATFEEAANTLMDALLYAYRQCGEIDEAFRREVSQSTVAIWSPTQVVDKLWSLRIEWDGTQTASKTPDARAQRTTDIASYRDIVRQLAQAFDEWELCRGPSMEKTGSRLSPEIFNNTMRKLRVALEGIKELVQAVRNRHSLMEHLVKELDAAICLLTDIADWWTTKQQTKEPEKRPASGNNGRDEHFE